MPPPQTRLDPEGLYDRLGLAPSASRSDIVAAYRAKARMLHPDVPQTGNATAFVAAKQAYDVLSNTQRRGAYDRAARDAARHADAAQASTAGYAAYPPTQGPRRPVPSAPSQPPSGPIRQPRFSDLPTALWVGFAALLCLCVFQVTTHLLGQSRSISDGIRPNAATVAPLSPSAHRAVLYGPAPVRLAGQTNFYVSPAADPAMLWRWDAGRDGLVPLAELPPFSAVQAVRLVRESGMLEVVLNDHASGFIRADHLTPGDATAARRAYCGYNAGPTPHDGELLERHGQGSATLQLENRAVEPAVIKLRDSAGAIMLSVFLDPGSHAAIEGLPAGTYHTDFAIGELWSRACNSFAAGMQARRLAAVMRLPEVSRLVVSTDTDEPSAADIPDQAFEQQ